MSEKSLLEVELARLCNRQFFPSPAAWEDQVLYFLILDRFSSQEAQELTVTDILSNIKAVLLTVPAAGFVIYE